MQRAVLAQHPQKQCCGRHERTLDPELTALDDRRHTHERDAHDKADVCGDRAYRIADGKVELAVNDAGDGHRQLRQSRCNAYYRCTDYELRYSGQVCDEDRRIDEPVAALDDEHQADDKQQNHKSCLHKTLSLHFFNRLRKACQAPEKCSRQTAPELGSALVRVSFQM